MTAMEKEVTDLSASVTNKTAVLKNRPIYFINKYIDIYMCVCVCVCVCVGCERERERE